MIVNDLFESGYAGNTERSIARNLSQVPIQEFAPADSGDNGEEDVLFRFAKMWYSAPDVATQRRVEQALAKVGWEIGELESEEGGAFVMRIGDEDGDSYIGWPEEELVMSEARKANTASARAEFSKRPRKDTLSDKEKEQKKSDSDAAWERLMAYADGQKKKEQSVAEGQNSSAKTLYKGKDAGGSEVTISYEPDYWPDHSEKYIIRFDDQVKAEMQTLDMAVRALTRDHYDTYRPDLQPNPKTALQQGVAESLSTMLANATSRNDLRQIRNFVTEHVADKNKQHQIMERATKIVAVQRRKYAALAAK